MSSFLDEMASLSERLMELLALSLDFPRDRFREDEPNVQMKIARYPPAPDVEDAGSNPIDGVGTFGVGAHTDSGYLSLLLRTTAGGLQVKNGAGEWIDAPPKPDTVVVNLGEMVQLCTGGYYLATPHRVVSRATPTGEEPAIESASRILEPESRRGGSRDGTLGDADVAAPETARVGRDGLARRGKERAVGHVRSQRAEEPGEKSPGGDGTTPPRPARGARWPSHQATMIDDCRRIGHRTSDSDRSFDGCGPKPSRRRVSVVF